MAKKLISPMDAYQTYWNEWASVFTKRATANRAQFWWPLLINIAIIFVATFVLRMISPALLILVSIFALITIVPNVSVAARRITEIGLSAWWLLLFLIPVVNFIMLLFVGLAPKGFMKK